MPKAIELLKAKRSSKERKLGGKEGDVKARTVIAGRSYDHVNTNHTGERELHPSNIDRVLGIVTETAARTYLARSGNTDLGEHENAHKAAHAIVSHKRGSSGLGARSATRDAGGQLGYGADEPGASDFVGGDALMSGG
jgi:hypothetical protein